jgi:3-oxoacyl-[acyl-carrier-protein] synthase-1
VKGIDRLVALGTFAVKEATQGLAHATAIGLVVCAPSDGLADEPDREALLTRLAADAGLLVDKRSRRLFLGGPTAAVEALCFARQVLYSRDLAAVCVLGVDSLSTQPRFGKLVRERPAQPDRFVPGEAAAAMLVTRPGQESLAILAGLGISAPDKHDTLSNPANSSRVAIAHATSEAGAEAPLAAFVHDLPATQSGSEELAWLQGGAIPAGPEIYVVFPASSTGETGAASGILSMVTLAFLIGNGEINGPGLCLLASADGARGAALLTHPTKRRLDSK